MPTNDDNVQYTNVTIKVSFTAPPNDPVKDIAYHIHNDKEMGIFPVLANSFEVLEEKGKLSDSIKPCSSSMQS